MDRDDLITELEAIKEAAILARGDLLTYYELGELMKADIYENPLEYLDGYIDALAYSIEAIDDGIPLDSIGITPEDIMFGISMSNEIINYLKANK